MTDDLLAEDVMVPEVSLSHIQDVSSNSPMVSFSFWWSGSDFLLMDQNVEDFPKQGDFPELIREAQLRLRNRLLGAAQSLQLAMQSQASAD